MSDNLDGAAAAPLVPERRSAGTNLGRREPNPWPKDRLFRILAIDGGGIRGILPAAFLARLEQEYLGDRSVSDCFDLVAGTSTGGILSLGLGRGLTARQINKTYQTRGAEIFPPCSSLSRPFYKVLGWFRQQCDHKALEKVIGEILEGKELWQSGSRLNIPTIDGKFGEVFIFKTPHHKDFRKDWDKPMARAARATSAAQSFYRPLSDGQYEYLDGGIWANNPVMVALVDALSCFDVPRENIRILSLGCVEGTMRINWLQRHLGGGAFWVGNLIHGGMHLQSQNALGQAGLLIGRHNLIRVDAPPGTPRPDLDDWTRSVHEMPPIADDLFNKFGEQVRDIFLTESATPYEPIYTPDRPPSA